VKKDGAIGKRLLKKAAAQEAPPLEADAVKPEKKSKSEPQAKSEKKAKAEPKAKLSAGPKAKTEKKPKAESARDTKPAAVLAPFTFASTADYTVMAFEMSAYKKGRIAAYDMDGTLIETKSGAKFPKGPDDWKWRVGVKEKLAEVYQTHDVVIITNQKKMSAKDVENKALALVDDLKLPLVFIAGHANEFYRKPHTGLWEVVSGGVDKGESFYVGDMKTDALFASNVGIDFHWANPYFGLPGGVLELGAHPLEGIVASPAKKYKRHEGKHLVVLVGPAASGKSSISRGFEGYVLVNRDMQKTDAKMKKIFDDALASGQSIVVDNTNPQEATRRVWIEAAKSRGYTTTILFVDIPKKAALELDEYRCEMTRGEVHIPEVAFNIFYSKLQRPTELECDELIVENHVNVPEETRKAMLRFRAT